MPCQYVAVVMLADQLLRLEHSLTVHLTHRQRVLKALYVRKVGGDGFLVAVFWLKRYNTVKCFIGVLVGFNPS